MRWTIAVSVILLLYVGKYAESAETHIVIWIFHILFNNIPSLFLSIVLRFFSIFIFISFLFLQSHKYIQFRLQVFRMKIEFLARESVPDCRGDSFSFAVCATFFRRLGFFRCCFCFFSLSLECMCFLWKFHYVELFVLVSTVFRLTKHF